MKHAIILLTFLAMLLAPAVQAQERLSREEALKYAFFTCVDLKQMLGTPIPTDPDVKRPAAIRDGDYGGLALPESKLSADTFAKVAKDKIAPLGQLWLVKLSPIANGETVPVSKLRMLKVSGEGREAEVACCALGVTKDDSGKLELLVYGSGKEPVARVALKSASVSGSHSEPIELSAEKQDDRGEVTLTFVGKYQATLSLTDPEG